VNISICPFLPKVQMRTENLACTLDGAHLLRRLASFQFIGFDLYRGKAVFTAHAARCGAHGLKILLSGLLIWPIWSANVAIFLSIPPLSMGAVRGAIRPHNTDS
jgi:hypothetical protein